MSQDQKKIIIIIISFLLLLLLPARSQEGRDLRSRHQANVSYLRSRLFEAGVAAQHTPSHIIPIHVSIAQLVVHAQARPMLASLRGTHTLAGDASGS